jgi:hypothetical protein
METKNIILILLSLLVLIAVLFFVMRKPKEGFYDNDSQRIDINREPLNAVYNPILYDCGDCAAPVSYGMNVEHNKDITMCDFIKKFDDKDEFVQNFNEDACDVPARQICEVLYAHHQQYFENMWSGLGECEIYQKEQCKKCPSGLLKVKENSPKA